MASSNMVILEGDHEKMVEVLEQLREDSNGKLAFLIDRNGQRLAASGGLDDVDPTSLASLAAGAVAATDGLVELIGENGFENLYLEGESDSLHLNVVGGAAILLVRFDENSSLGLVRLRVRKATELLAPIVQEIAARGKSAHAPAQEEDSPFSEITDADIDALFG